MILNGINYGRRFRQNIFRGFISAGTSKFTKLPLKDIPVKIGSLHTYIHSIDVTIPTASFAIAASKTIDLTSILQLIASSNLSMCTDAPPTKAGMSQYLWQGVDGFRLFNAFAWMTGRKALNLQAPIYPVNTVAADSTTAQNTVGAMVGRTGRGWSSGQGPYGAADAGGATFSDRLMFRFPIGARYGYSVESNVVPSEYLSGNFCGCGRVQPNGSLDIMLGALVDNQAVTFGTEGFDLDVNMVLLPEDAPVIPTMMSIKTFDGVSTGNALELQRGIRSLFSFTKPLDSAGAEQLCDSTNYTQVTAKCNGEDLIPQTVTDAIAQLQAIDFDSDPEGPEADTFVMLPGQPETSGLCAKTRYMTPGLPLLADRDDARYTPGSWEQPTIVTAVVSTVSAHSGIDAVWIPTTDDYCNAARTMAGANDKVPVPRTKTGTTPHAIQGPLYPRRLLNPNGGSPLTHGSGK